MIPNDVKKKIEAKINETYSALNWNSHCNVSGTTGGYTECAAGGFELGASFGYSLSLPRIQELEKEVERLKGLIVKAYTKGYNTGSVDEYKQTESEQAVWEKFKTDNNL